MKVSKKKNSVEACPKTASQTVANEQQPTSLPRYNHEELNALKEVVEKLRGSIDLFGPATIYECRVWKQISDFMFSRGFPRRPWARLREKCKRINVAVKNRPIAARPIETNNTPSVAVQQQTTSASRPCYIMVLPTTSTSPTVPMVTSTLPVAMSVTSQVTNTKTTSTTVPLTSPIPVPQKLASASTVTSNTPSCGSTTTVLNTEGTSQNCNNSPVTQNMNVSVEKGRRNSSLSPPSINSNTAEKQGNERVGSGTECNGNIPGRPRPSIDNEDREMARSEHLQRMTLYYLRQDVLRLEKEYWSRKLEDFKSTHNNTLTHI